MIQDTHIEQNLVITKKMMIKQFAKVFFIFDFAVILFCIISNNTIWLYNTQIAFISSLFISIATFLSYKRNVEKRLQNAIADVDAINDRDVIDEIDDPYDLYSEDNINEEKELSAQEIKTIIQEEKLKVKRNSFKNTIFSAPGFVSVSRISGYATLIIGFFYLNNHSLFEPISYLLGLSIVPIAMLFTKVITTIK